MLSSSFLEWAMERNQSTNASVYLSVYFDLLVAWMWTRSPHPPPPASRCSWRFLPVMAENWRHWWGGSADLDLNWRHWSWWGGLADLDMSWRSWSGTWWSLSVRNRHSSFFLHRWFWWTLALLLDSGLVPCPFLFSARFPSFAFFELYPSSFSGTSWPSRSPTGSGQIGKKRLPKKLFWLL